MAISELCTESYPVLPLVYGDSLSYYETVCKLVEKVNELVDEVNKLKGVKA